MTGELDHRSAEQRLDALEHAAQLELDCFDDEVWLAADLDGQPDDAGETPAERSSR